MDARKRHKLLWHTARPLAIFGSWLLFGYTAEVCHEEGPLLVMANHNANLDPLLVACSFPEPLYCVASEHIMRKGAVSDFLRWSTNIIPRQKGGSGSATVRNIVRNLHEGCDVCLFPEGNRSWDGETRAITPSTGKLARMSGAKLVTYRTEGVYFSNPRWSGGSIRRGRSKGRIMGIYTPEELKALSPKQVQELIERDLYENAYERQKTEHTKFYGLKLAEHLETLLFICPHCKAEGKMRSSGNYFICDACGRKLRYGFDGFFVGEDVIYDTVLDWGIWQKQLIAEKCKNAGKEPIFSDTEMNLYRVNTAVNDEFIAQGVFALYKDRLELPGGEAIPLEKLTGMSLMGPQTLFFSAGKDNYVIKCDKIRCTSKYLSACKVFDKSLQYGI